MQLSQRDINRLRYQKERWLYVVCMLINTLAVYALLVGLFLVPIRVLVSSNYLGIYLAVTALIVTAFMGMGSTYARTRVYAVRIDNGQFPALYEVVKRYTTQLGLSKIPAVYIEQEGGILNAFASYFWGRNYVRLNTDILEVAYLEHQDMDAVSFIIAHEMAHIRLRHTSLWRNLSILISKYIPILGPALSRAQEYSCDSIAKTLCPEGVHGIFILLLGRHLYQNVNVERYLKQAEGTKGWFEFTTNLSSSHPVHTRRVLALYNDEQKGKLFF